MKVPFLDLRAANAPFQEDIDAAVLRVARSGRYILGPEVEAFEREWAAFNGASHCIGTANGSQALQLLLMAAEIGPGDEVIVASNTYIATWLSVSHAGAKLVPVEPDPATFNIDPRRVEAALTRRTRAIVGTHLYGRPCAMEALRGIADTAGVYLFFDAAQAHGAAMPAKVADGQAWSFYPTKNLGAIGDAGAVTVDDGQLAARIRKLRNYGGAGPVGKYDHEVRGYNARLDEIQAAVLRAKLKRLHALNARRRQRAEQYHAELGQTLLVLPALADESCWHQFVVRSPQRDRIAESLAARGIETQVHYPVPPHRSVAYADVSFPAMTYPIADRLADEVLSLPIGYECDVPAIARAVRAVAGTLMETAHA